MRYETFFENNTKVKFVKQPSDSESNYWLNCVLLNNKTERDAFLKATNENGVMTRPAWTLISELSMFKDCQNGGLEISKILEERLVNLPSSVQIKAI
jgi:dTDP-4-amino-4,6-dideoxygalactose transaminase